MKKIPFVSTVVLNWNGKRFVDPFVETFLQQTYPKDSLELIFADNGSTDDSVEYLQTKYGGNPLIKTVLNGKNYGYSEGNNRGMRQTRGDYVLICNNDLELDKNLIKELVSVAEKYQAAAVVPKLMYLNKSGVINNAGSRLEPTSDWPVYEIGKDEKDTGQFDSVREVTALCGACVLFSRKFLSKVGMFDKRFFMYFEDGDLSWRGQAAGYDYYYAPEAVAYHYHTGSSKEGSPLFNHFVGRNRILILAKNASYFVLAKGLAKTLRDHLFLRIKNLLVALTGRYSKRQAWREFWLSQKLLWATLFMLPYALLKRYKIIKEDRL